MSAVLIGELGLGVLNPLTLEATADVSAGLNAQLTGALALQAQVAITPPTLAVQLAALLKVVAQLEASIALGLPGISFSASAAAALVAKIEAEIGVLFELTALLMGASVFVYSYSGGTVSTIGSDLSSAIATSPPPGLIGSSPVTGLLLGASAPVWPTIAPYFGGL
jgi:hypothetical protein